MQDHDIIVYLGHWARKIERFSGMGGAEALKAVDEDAEDIKLLVRSDLHDVHHAIDQALKLSRTYFTAEAENQSAKAAALSSVESLKKLIKGDHLEPQIAGLMPPLSKRAPD